jgi:hypothetical protein
MSDLRVVVKVDDLLPPGIESLGENERVNPVNINHLWHVAAKQATARYIYHDLKANTLPALPPPVELFAVDGLYAIVSGL